MPTPLRYPLSFIKHLNWRIQALSFYVQRGWRNHEQYAQLHETLMLVRSSVVNKRPLVNAAARVWHWYEWWYCHSVYVWSNDWDNAEARQYRTWLREERDRRLLAISDANKAKLTGK